MSDFSEDARQNPAAQAEGKSLATLFATDPMELSSQDREEIIKAFRQQRQEFIQNGGNAKKSKKKAASKVQDLDIDVGDIDI